MKLFIFVFLVLFSLNSFSSNYHHPYYPSEVHQKIWSMNLKGHPLKRMLKNVLHKQHVENFGKADTLADHCPSDKTCYNKENLGYYQARKHLFGQLHLQVNNQGYFIKDVYCNRTYNNNTPDIHTIGPMEVPNHRVLNCEHTWPQSRFSDFHDDEEQKSDLHHLFPTEKEANNIRANYEFGEISHSTANNNLCNTSDIGEYLNHPNKFFSHLFFTPPAKHRGNVARALFYFSIQYDLPISLDEEYYLREWHDADPVDQDEIDRNEAIYQIQNNRNPFIDYPFTVTLITDF